MSKNNVKMGEGTMKNGAKMIGFLRNTYGEYFVAADTNGMAGDPFATWAISPEGGDTYWGHYFENEADAMADLISRAGFKLEEA